jgi:uncharacterized membrane protein
MANEKTNAPTSIGLDENLAGALAYLPLIGLIFLFLEKKSTFVRFHSVQSLLIALVSIVLSFIPIIGWIASCLILVVMVIGAVKAYNGERFKLPVIGKIAEEQSQNLPS